MHLRWTSTNRLWDTGAAGCWCFGEDDGSRAIGHGREVRAPCMGARLLYPVLRAEVAEPGPPVARAGVWADAVTPYVSPVRCLIVGGIPPRDAFFGEGPGLADKVRKGGDALVGSED